MRCPYCGMVFTNKSGICPRCHSDVTSYEFGYPWFKKELFRIGDYPIDFMRLYCLIAINLCIAYILVNIITFRTFASYWAFPASVGMIAIYQIFAMLSVRRRNILVKFRGLYFFLLLTMVLVQILVTDGHWCTDYAMPGLTLLCYFLFPILHVKYKSVLRQKYITLFYVALIGLIPFILILCGYTGNGGVAYYLGLVSFIASIFILLNLIFFGIVKIKYNVGGLLE